MKPKLLALVLATGAVLCASTGVRVAFGPPPPPPHIVRTPLARPGHVWVGGYYYPSGRRWMWHQGYWTRPPYAHASWVSPRYYGGRWYRGYWRR